MRLTSGGATWIVLQAEIPIATRRAIKETDQFIRDDGLVMGKLRWRMEPDLSLPLVGRFEGN